MTICGYSVALTPGLSVDHRSRSVAVSMTSVIQNLCDEDSHVIDCAAVEIMPTLRMPHSCHGWRSHGFYYQTFSSFLHPISIHSWFWQVESNITLHPSGPRCVALFCWVPAVHLCPLPCRPPLGHDSRARISSSLSFFTWLCCYKKANSLLFYSSSVGSTIYSKIIKWAWSLVTSSLHLQRGNHALPRQPISCISLRGR